MGFEGLPMEHLGDSQVGDRRELLPSGEEDMDSYSSPELDAVLDKLAGTPLQETLNTLDPELKRKLDAALSIDRNDWGLFGRLAAKGKGEKANEYVKQWKGEMMVPHDSQAEINARTALLNNLDELF